MRAVVNFSKPGPWPNTWYGRGQERLVQSLKDTGWKGGLVTFNDEHQVNTPSHSVVPYGFKIGAINEAVKKGYTTLLWADASVFAIKPIDAVFEHIEKHGHIFFHAGFNCAQWTNDRALQVMGVNRDDAEKMPMYLACCMGFDVTNPRTKLFLDQLTTVTFTTDALRGNWTNEHRLESRDPRCQGHRHDQSVGSILAATCCMDITYGAHTFFTYFGPKMFDYGGHNDMSPYAESIVLLAQGMNS